MMTAPKFSIVLSLLAGCALAAASLGVAVAQPRTDRLTPSPPVECTGSGDIEVIGKLIEADEHGVVVRGNCDVVIRDSRIIAKQAGVLVAFNGDVEIHHSYIEGGEAGLIVAGNGDIEFQNTVVRGGTSIRGNGDIEDLGGNDVQGRASQRPLPGVSLPGIEVDEHGVRMPGVEVDEDGVRLPGVEVNEDGVQLPGMVIRTGKGSYDWRDAGADYSTEDLSRLLAELGATVEHGRLHLQMAGDILFDFDSTAVRPDAAAELAKVAALIRQGSEGVVTVVGHTDSVGGEVYNQSLSEKRARAVTRWLNRNEGIPLQIMEAAGAGETQPVTYNTMPNGSDNPDGRAKNRRVEVSFTARESVTAAVPARTEATQLPKLAAGKPPASCADVCRSWTAVNDIQSACVVAALDRRGYEVIGNLGCIDVSTPGECAICWKFLGVSDEDCASVSQSCLGR